MNNVEQLRNELITVFDQVKSGAISLQKAKELSCCADKIMKSAALQLSYNSFTNTKASIAFLQPGSPHIELPASANTISIQALPPEREKYGFVYWAIKALSQSNIPLIDFYLKEGAKKISGKNFRGYKKELESAIKEGILKRVKLKDKFSAEYYYCLPQWVGSSDNLITKEHRDALIKNGVIITE